ncbi:uncharacterized protein Kmn2 [Drosophila bipectinata]|uniref:uncharacterized protein Kmn2 n=1 Tax=Drosophila bipectinata TaxID=42026 RepID=UPI0038B266BE
MEDLTVSQLEDLRQLQLQLNANRDIYINLYTKIIKQTFSTQMNNLVDGEFNIEAVKLNVPQKPPMLPPQEYTPMHQLSTLEEVYKATMDGLSML